MITGITVHYFEGVAFYIPAELWVTRMMPGWLYDDDEYEYTTLTTG